jgi:hypothetical protein
LSRDNGEPSHEISTIVGENVIVTAAKAGSIVPTSRALTNGSRLSVKRYNHARPEPIPPPGY